MSLLVAVLLSAAVEEPLPAAEGSLAPWLTPGAVSWLEPADGGYRLRLSQRADGGWAAPVTVAESPRLLANWADGPMVASSSRGAWLASFGRRGSGHEHAADVMLMGSDDARAWRELGAAHDDGTATEHGFVSLLPDGPGFLAVWLDGRKTAASGPMTLRAAAVAGGKLQAAVELDDRVCDCCGTSAAMTAEGPVVVYRDRSADEVRDIWSVRRVKGRWSKPQRVGADGWKIPGCPVNGPAIAASGRSAAVAWYTYAESKPRVRVAFSSNAGASFGPPIDVDAAHDRSAPIGRVGVALEPSGAALVSWVAADREDARVLVRRVSPAGLVGEALAVTTGRSDRQSGFPRIALDGDALLIAWTSKAVKLTRLPTAELPAASAKPAAQAQQATTTPERAPGQEVTTLDGKPASLEALRGGAVLVNFWATWCEPCRAELPELVALDQRLRGRGLTVVGVSVDRDLPADRIRAFADRRKVAFTLWRDPGEALAGAFGVTQLPATYLIDAQGRVVWSATGAISASNPALDAALEKALVR